MVEVDERAVGPDDALKLLPAHQLAMPPEKVLEGSRGLETQPHTARRLPELPCAPTFRSYVGNFEYFTANGTLTMREMGMTEPPDVNNPESGVVNAFQRIVAGTGEFAGATGYLFVSGFKPQPANRDHCQWRDLQARTKSNKHGPAVPFGPAAGSREADPRMVTHSPHALAMMRPLCAAPPVRGAAS